MNVALVEDYVQNPEKLLMDIDRQLEDADIENLPMIFLDGNEQVEKTVIAGVPKHSVLEALLLGSKDKIKTVCCEQFNYCEAMKNHSDTVTLIQVIGDTLVAALISFPIPIVTVSSYCVLSLFLNRVCNCKKNSNSHLLENKSE